MKKERIMKNNPSRYPSAVRPIICSVASALALMAGAANAEPGKFAKVPLYLQNETKIDKQPEIKHNIMLFIDDSGSMKEMMGRRTRMDITKDALNKVLEAHGSKFNWALQTLNNSGGTDTTDAQKFTVPATEIATRVKGITPNGGTPTTSRYFELVSQIVMPSVEYRCQKSYVVLMSDGDANLSCKRDNRGNTWSRSDFRYGFSYRYSDYYQRNIGLNEPLYRQAYDYFESRNAGRCIFRQGGAYDDVWDINNGLSFFSHKLAEQDFKTTGTDKAGKSWNGDPGDPADYSKQLVKTFTVGFGEGISSSGRMYLQNGTSEANGYYTADQPEKLLQAFNGIIDQINADTDNSGYDSIGATAPATTSSSLPGMAAVIGLKTTSWSSQILFRDLSFQKNNDGQNQEIQQTDTLKSPSFNNRLTLINTTGSNTYLFGPGRPLARQAGLNNAYFDIPNLSNNSGEWVELLNWTARIKADEEIERISKSTPYSQTYRVRKPDERDLGDILDGSVAAIGQSEFGQQEYMVAAANDGMVHLFRSSSDANHPYDLKVSYIPAMMERDVKNGDKTESTTLAKVLKNIAKDSYTTSINNHEYMINGGFTLRQTPANDIQRVFMFGAMGQGGRGAYALNIGGKEDKNTVTGIDTSDTSWSDKVPLFETPKGAGNTLGYTIGTPQIGRISVERPANNGRVDVTQNIRYAGFLASGYRVEDKNGAENETALYIYEMLGKEVGTGDKRGSSVGTAGSLLKKIEVPGGVGGLSTPTLLDTDFDGVIDVAYAGDRGGNMYRFDLRGETSADWSVAKIFSGTPSKPITSAPAVSRRSADEYVVIFGTGSEIYQDDLTNRDQQSIYGIYENLKSDAPAVTEANVAKEGDLQEQTISEENGYIYLTHHQIGSDKKGWKIDLRTGERVSVKPTMILRTAVVTVRRYESETHKTSTEADKCLPTSSSTRTATKTSFIGVNADDGGALNGRSARFTPDTVIRKSDGFGIQYANGLTQEGIVNFTFLNPSKLDDSPVTADGDSGGTGTDKELAVAPSTPNNKCFPGSEARGLLLNKGTPLEVHGRLCGLQRISWRELFTF